ncbi:hypothetical protein CUMW_234930 [Citrus unshiu]|uniref:Uncharacterized protein n=3 Tax=Citrus TaxID=2706 RepID=A0A2H5QJ30_CITUN|nr:hypothetical protein CUMW_234930 [Citrus unshiu]
MRFLRRIAGFLGIVRDNGPEVKDDEEDQDKIDDNNNQRSYNFQETGLPRKGFGVQVQVAVERPLPGPIIVPCNSGNGGVQANVSSNEVNTLAISIYALCSLQMSWELIRNGLWKRTVLKTHGNPDSIPSPMDSIQPDTTLEFIQMQGLRWYAKRLRIDDDGDVADEFLDEVLPQTSASEEEQHRPLPKFEVRYSTRPVKVKNQVLTTDGKIQQCVEYRGSLLWV